MPTLPSQGNATIALSGTSFAGVAELVDAADSKSAGSDTVRVRVPSPAPNRQPLATALPLIFPLYITKALTGAGTLVFPQRAKPKRPMSENTILYALYRMGYHSRATGHGFRAAASTILNEIGLAPDVIERQLAYVERNKVRAYNRA